LNPIAVAQPTESLLTRSADRRKLPEAFDHLPSEGIDMGKEIEQILGEIDHSRRDFLRKVIVGAAFAPPLIASFSLDGLSLATADAQIAVRNQCFSVSNSTSTTSLVPLVFDFSDTQYQDNFRDILRGPDINSGFDLAGGNHPALNFTGSANAAGSTWMTVVESDTCPTTQYCVPGSFSNEDLFFDLIGLKLSADVLIHRFNNTKGVGLVAGFNEQGGLGLVLLLWNAGNSDVLQLFTVDSAGKLTSLASKALGSAIKEDAWYHLEMEILPALQPLLTQTSPVDVAGRVSRHVTPEDPDSDIQNQIGEVVLQAGVPVPAGLNTVGEVGLIARAISAAVDSSVTNFVIACGKPKLPLPIRPEPF